MYGLLINIKMIFFIIYVSSFLNIHVSSEFYQVTTLINETTKDTYCIASEEHKYSKLNYLNSKSNDFEKEPIVCESVSDWGYYNNKTGNVDKQITITCKPNHQTISTFNEESILRIFPGKTDNCIKFKLNMCENCKLQEIFKGTETKYITSSGEYIINRTHSMDFTFKTKKDHTSRVKYERGWNLTDITHCITKSYINKLTPINETVECLFNGKNISTNLIENPKTPDACLENCTKLFSNDINYNTSYCRNVKLISSTTYCNSSIPENEVLKINYSLYLLLSLVPVTLIIIIIIIFVFRRRKNKSMQNAALKTLQEESGQNNFVENEVYESFSTNAEKKNERNIVEIENYELYEPYTVNQNSSNIKLKNNQLCMTSKSSESQNCAENNVLYESINGD